MILPIVTHPNPILRNVALPIDPDRLKRGEFRPLIHSMIETMVNAQGVGLAANQVNERAALCVVATDRRPIVLANPRIRRASFRKDIEEEGCLSIPNVWGAVRRSRHIEVEALDETGTPVTFTAKDFFARVIQHEVDHLDGVLISDKFVRVTRGETGHDAKR